MPQHKGRNISKALRESPRNLALMILAFALTISIIVLFTEPTAQREGATKKTAMLVEYQILSQGQYQPEIHVTGNVISSQEIELSSQVAGAIVSVSSDFIPGGVVEAGTELLKVDPRDYEHSLALAESQLAQAQADLTLELGQQKVAKRDYELIDGNIEIKNKKLILRKPQLKAAQAKVAAARASVNQARLNLKRTSFVAPFAAQILSRHVSLGSQVQTGQSVGRLAGIESYWIEAALPVRKVSWVQTGEQAGIDDKSRLFVKVMNPSQWQENQFRRGYLEKVVKALDSKTRMARVLVAIDDPLHRLEEEQKEKLPLLLGDFVELELPARFVNDVVRIDRTYLRKDNTVWLAQDDRLAIKKVDIVFQDRQFAYARNIADQSKIITSHLSAVVDGAAIRFPKIDPQESAQNP